MVAERAEEEITGYDGLGGENRKRGREMGYYPDKPSIDFIMFANIN